MWLKGKENRMPNLNEMSAFLKIKDVKHGDIVTFADAGTIKDVDFSTAKDGSKIKRVFEVMLELSSGVKKICTLNKGSQRMLALEWGEITEKWVGKEAEATFVEQLVFGELKPVLIFRPMAEIKEGSF